MTECLHCAAAAAAQEAQTLDQADIIDFADWRKSRIRHTGMSQVPGNPSQNTGDLDVMVCSSSESKSETSPQSSDNLTCN